MRILVTGGKGFIGSHLAYYLEQEGYWVRSVARAKPSPLFIFYWIICKTYYQILFLEKTLSLGARTIELGEISLQ